MSGRGGGGQLPAGAPRGDSPPAARERFLLLPLPREPPTHQGTAEPTGGLGRIAERSRGVTKPRARKGEREAGDTCSWGTAQDDRVSEPAAKRGAISSPLKEPPRQEENRGRAEGEPPPLRGIYEGQPQGRVLSQPPDGARATTGCETAPTAVAAARRRSAESREGPGGGAQAPEGGISGGKARDLGWEHQSTCDSKNSQEPPEGPREDGRPMAPRGIWKSSGRGASRIQRVLMRRLVKSKSPHLSPGVSDVFGPLPATRGTAQAKPRREKESHRRQREAWGDEIIPEMPQL